ncbi:MAG: carbonate dehydratase [Crocinitomicaceae bacterium]|nr:carbonate dehydratase [Crocinitomicaceae bacterium]
MHSFEKLLLENKAWAQEKVEENPHYFEKLVNLQTPEFLWIGCSDSRVPANEITGTNPGEIFVHRNIANMVVHTDLNLLSVLQYAVEVLNVRHVIVCGHYGCGGVKAAMTNHSMGIINKWLRNIKDVYRIHYDEIQQKENEEERTNRLVELNVIEQVVNLSKTSIIQKAWIHHGRPHLHGWVYALADGLLKPIKYMTPEDGVDPIYRYDNL